jgi:hypothetical protein
MIVVTVGSVMLLVLGLVVFAVAAVGVRRDKSPGWLAAQVLAIVAMTVGLWDTLTSETLRAGVVCASAVLIVRSAQG